MSEKKQQLEWDEKYSVEVAEIDNQHKKMFATINELIGAINSNSAAEHLDGIIKQLLEYKEYHFATEEKYFKEFGYEGAEEHIAKHLMFGEKLASIQEKCAGNTLMLSFELVDFLEDWLIEHLMTFDQKYKDCFKTHGLK